MNFNNIKIAAEIVKIPRTFQGRRDMSTVALLKEMGYFELYDQVTVSDIREALTRDSARVQEWMQYCEDRRCSGWYVTLNNEDLYEVGFFDHTVDPHYSNRVQYESAMDACAEFIKHEIERVRSHVIEDIQKHQETVERKRALNRARNNQ
jgi:hypothetical protein